MLAYDGPWSPDVFSVALTSAIEQQVQEMQAQRIVMVSSLASLFSPEAMKKLDRAITRTTANVRSMKLASRGIDPARATDFDDSEDPADQFVRVFQRMGVMGK